MEKGLSREKNLLYITLLFCILCLCIGGAAATWRYTIGSPDPALTVNGMGINPFLYKPEEVLPDEDEAAKIQQNHMDLLYNILHLSKYGLNPGSVLENAVASFGVLRSQENISGGNLKHLFTTKESQLLDFALAYENDTQYVLYTFVTEDLEGGTVDSTRVPVFKILITYEDGKWDSPGAYAGHAVIREFTTSNNKTYRTINPADFVIGTL